MKVSTNWCLLRLLAVKMSKNPITMTPMMIKMINKRPPTIMPKICFDSSSPVDVLVVASVVRSAISVSGDDCGRMTVELEG